ncbi:uncharacterized protein EI97DRAFT_74369 [Westerdykella ornata]|uniref:Uncharacterized protein n=1 Tax=Westerdykella ornata TaxID=318751 RepID=A0A6A6JGG0_WESOR|nr:uncharacterized protein EI97DRAFT_74369 [Westerdykella ornata]KAF2275427.1 hypothetical protein EI97DRAFT_74369 [Westerdykella ornata]
MPITSWCPMSLIPYPHSGTIPFSSQPGLLGFCSGDRVIARSANDFLLSVSGHNHEMTRNYLQVQLHLDTISVPLPLPSTGNGSIVCTEYPPQATSSTPPRPRLNAYIHGVLQKRTHQIFLQVPDNTAVQSMQTVPCPIHCPPTTSRSPSLTSSCCLRFIGGNSFPYSALSIKQRLF